MWEAGGPGRVPGIVFLAIVIVAIAALLAGYGVPVGLGALAGLALGVIAGAFGSLWLGRGAGRSINLGGVAWSSYDTSDAPSAELVAEMRELTEVLGIDLGAIHSILPVLATVEANGLAVQLVVIELHEAGARLIVDVLVLPGALPPPSIAEVSVTDDVGTRYQASGQGQGGSPNRARYEISLIPALAPTSRELSIRIDRFVDLFPGERRTSVGPWPFIVALPAGIG